MPRTSGGTAPAVLLLHGEERFLVEEKARALIAGWRHELVSVFGYEPLDGSALVGARVLDAMLQPPFLDTHLDACTSCVIVTHAKLLMPALAQILALPRL